MAIAMVEPKSQHVSDPAVQPFLQADFDPATYLNTTLPSLSLSNNRSAQGTAVPLPELSSQTQTLLSQLNAQTSRLSNTLTQLTDEILRSGGRLAYEVEVLRAETTGLTDAFDKDLKEDIELLVPPTKTVEPLAREEAQEGTVEDTSAHPVPTATHEPTYLADLRTLSSLRARLDEVIKIFGEATAWPAAPSEVGGGGFISISGPEATEETRNREEKAKVYTDKLRTEINDLLASNDAAGLEAATTRVEELRTLAGVWKGTAEEKARQKTVESLGRTIEEKQKALGKTATNIKKAPAREPDMRYGDPAAAAGGEGGYGFLQNLRNLKNEMYLD